MKAGQGHPAPAAPAPSRNRRWLAVLAAPAVVPLSRSAVFAALRARLRPDVADNAGFFLCWPGWYFAFPTWVLGEQRACDVRRRGRRPALGEAALLAIPVYGGIATELVPDRREIDARVTAVMVRSAVVNAIGEELPWRGVFTQELPDDAWKGVVWPLAGFSVWHYAPQLVLPSRLGRSRFVAGSAMAGAAATVAAWHGRGLRWVLAPPAATDACGVRAALFRLRGRLDRLMTAAGTFAPGQVRESGYRWQPGKTRR
jgi:CAAX prenyl protease-like protein